MSTLQSPPAVRPDRPEAGHKGTFGTILVIGGRDDADAVMAGAPALAALGAFRVGGGRVMLAIPRSLASTCLGIVPSATLIPRAASSDSQDWSSALEAALSACDTVVIGPGLGTSDQAARLLRIVLASKHPVIVDADALSLLARDPELVRTGTGPIILTPHPGEYRRLARALSLPPDPREDQAREDAAGRLARALGSTVILKGAGTVVHDGKSAWTCRRGSVALATAGTGDVLAGMLAGMMASRQPGTDLIETASLAVWVHAVAGERWSDRHGDRGLLAIELSREIPAVMSSLPPSRSS